MTDNVMHHAIALLADGKNLTQDLATRVFQIIMNGGATPAQMAALLMGLRIKGETVDEITGGALALRAKAQKIHAPENSIDTCGTGGDSRGTYNISTAVALVLAACGLPVAKHGNRSVSSKSGSADVLTALGVKTDAEISVVERCLQETNIAFLMASKFHPAMRHVAPVRQELGLRTIFNILGPLSNPANPAFQLLGVYNKSLVRPLAEVLKSLDLKAAWVVHGEDGLDELTLSGATYVAELKNGEIREFTITPEDAGLPHSSLEDVKGGDAEHNAAKLREAISGVEGAYRNAILYNAAAALVIAGRAVDLKTGVQLAKGAIDSGKAYGVLGKLVEVSNSQP